jgi:hypothetical protein
MISKTDLKWVASRGFEVTIGPGRYLAFGLLLAAVKLHLDRLLASGVFGRPWVPEAYAFPGRLGGIFAVDRDERAFYLSMLALSLPFLAVGLMLTLQRLRDAGWPLWLAAFFFAPAPLNLIFFLTLSFTPGIPRSGAAAMGDVIDMPAGANKAPRPRASCVRALAAILIPLPFAAAVAYLATHVFEEYGWSVFIGLPFVLPMVSVIIYGYDTPRSLMECLRLGLAWILVAGLVVLATAFEGIICLLMALPLMLPVVMLGTMVGYFIVRGHRAGRSRDLGKAAMLALATLPAMLGAEVAMSPDPPLYEVKTSLEVDAPADRVWHHVIAFPDLGPPTDAVFRSGIAFPIRARIEGRGVGAVRYCEFSTGSFVEPIEAWDEPRLLRFEVTSNPPPMREWNPFFDIHPPHLDGFLVSRRGQFRLVALPGERTLLEGTTWYSHGLWPAGYWRLWSDAIIHRIHARVLRHIKALAEGGPPGRSVPR